MADDRLDQALAAQERADHLLSAGDLAGAALALRESIALFEDLDGPSSPDVANLLQSLASVLDRQGQYAESLKCAERAVSIMNEVLPLIEGPEGKLLLTQALGAQGTALRQLGRYAEAESILRRAIATSEDADELSMALNNFGILCKYSGNFSDGEQAYQRALTIARQSAGEISTIVATLLHNIGGLEHARGCFESALQPSLRAWEIRRELLGDHHVDSLADACAYGGVLDGLGRHTESKAIYEQALATYEEVFGPEHFEIGATLHNLAAAEAGLGNPEAAVEHYRRALAIKGKLLGENHPEWALTANNLALLLYESGRVGEATALLKKASAVMDSTLYPGHPMRGMTTSNLNRVAPPDQ